MGRRELRWAVGNLDGPSETSSPALTRGGGCLPPPAAAEPGIVSRRARPDARVRPGMLNCRLDERGDGVTNLLQKAFDEAAKLPEKNQDALGSLLLDEIEVERRREDQSGMPWPEIRERYPHQWLLLEAT